MVQGAAWCREGRKYTVHDPVPGTVTGVVSADDVDALEDVAPAEWAGDVVVYSHFAGAPPMPPAHYPQRHPLRRGSVALWHWGTCFHGTINCFFAAVGCRLSGVGCSPCSNESAVAQSPGLPGLDPTQGGSGCSVLVCLADELVSLPANTNLVVSLPPLHCEVFTMAPIKVSAGTASLLCCVLRSMATHSSAVLFAPALQLCLTLSSPCYWACYLLNAMPHQW